MTGLRERKRARTHAAISDAAIALFLEHGFDQVSVAQVAEAAEVSKRTVFAYFPTKEDLVVHRFADHRTEAARVVRARPSGTGPLAALRAHFLAALRDRDPVTGLNDVPQILALTRMVRETPALRSAALRFQEGAEQALAEALQEAVGVPDLTARLAASHVLNTQWLLSMDNFRALAAGRSADERYPEAVADAEHAFTLLSKGLGGYL
ncbi:TetR family transcriptional regulator [Streptomyces sp. Ru71]|uniref:TetR family transcriptional regulator n=1 Tax=Streptomyces sp. Ru71 TaxID=2080746 RepID=UPI000CDE54AA|nr:TetR family transcriptional regulator [Streptomyces sp. Ru71]POX55060.1 TetR family transcriptional regulator [Streptomyces sp. Ru71]